MYHLALQNGPFRKLKRAVLQLHLACICNRLIINRLQRCILQRQCLNNIYKLFVAVIE